MDIHGSKGQCEMHGSNNAQQTPRPRSIEGTYPSRISSERNMETPMGSDSNVSKPIVRAAELPSGNRNAQEAKASNRKVTGNRLDRASCSTRKGADVGMVSHPKTAVTVINEGES